MRRMSRFVITVITIGALLWPAVWASAQEAAPKPDLVVDKITLNPSGNIVVEIRNAGPGPLPDTAWRSTESFAACFVIMIGVQFVDYATIWAADPNRVLKNPGGIDHVHKPHQDTGAHYSQGMDGHHGAGRRGQ